jgi:hypothetical protein
MKALAGMGVMSRGIDKLPSWVRVILMLIAIGASIYYVAHYGFFSFLLRMIFSPEI